MKIVCKYDQNCLQVLHLPGLSRFQHSGVSASLLIAVYLLPQPCLEVDVCGEEKQFYWLVQGTLGLELADHHPWTLVNSQAWQADPSPNNVLVLYNCVFFYFVTVNVNLGLN